ncbi:MAG: polysaccharide biosynthesis/export family protein [Thermodesulfobacteriota bacterium]|nr:polysaccharide biosynthesis/export family protein [Thermodesulfobacteriota bacterium]
MRRNFISVVVMAIVLTTISSLWAADQPTTTTTGDYIIGPGDVLDISVWNNEALTKLVTVLPDGKIYFPLIGEIVVGGKTVAFLQKDLNDRISPFVPNPNLSLMVQEINSLLIYVIGKVNRPGRLALNTNINVLQALTMAGGLNAFANRNNIKIFRETKDKTFILPFEYDDVTEGKNLEQNIVLKRGDIIVIP